MLEFDMASKCFGSVLALDACTFTAQPGRLTGFPGSERRGKDDCDAGGIRAR